MAEFALTARTPLDGYARTFGGVALAEAGGLSLVSAAVPNGGDDAFAAALAKGFGASRPSTGESVPGDRFGARVLGMQPDQVFVLFEAPDPDRAAETASAALGPAAYVTDQSDSWAMLRIEGRACARRWSASACSTSTMPLSRKAAWRAPSWSILRSSSCATERTASC